MVPEMKEKTTPKTLQDGELIEAISNDWMVTKIENGSVHMIVIGDKWIVPVSRFSDMALRNLRAIFLGRIHGMMMGKRNLWEYVEMTNTELSRRTNNKTGAAV
ncbi:MAG TPA: hypothetical protein ACFYEK_08950 [Candidatus Wunengus sp. YC60]|uniref:hypothetical protein n=1 Tax=Candidatus Wunengus sp. YC60 TaxID=3367697 RepID=UPI0040250B16